MELWGDDSSNLYFQFKYNGQSLTLPGCSGPMCDWTTVDKLMQSRIPPSGTGCLNINMQELRSPHLNW